MDAITGPFMSLEKTLPMFTGSWFFTWIWPEMASVISPRVLSLAVIALNTMKFISGGVRKRSEATSKWYWFTVLMLEVSFTLTGIIFDVAPRVPAIPVER